MTDKKYTLGIDIGSTTVKIAILDEENQLLFADYERHFANIQETLAHLLGEAHEKLGELTLQPVITGSGGLALANHLGIPFTQEVIAVSTSLKALAPQTDVAIELGGEDAKIIYFEGGNVELFSFARQPDWKGQLTPDKLATVDALLQDYDACLSRIRACRVPLKANTLRT